MKKTRIAVVLATAVLIVLATATAVTARSRGAATDARVVGAGIAHTLRAASVSGPTLAAVRKAVKTGTAPATVAATTFPGYSYCQDPRMTTWAAYDPAHQATMTRSYVVKTATGDFNDATIVASPWYWAGTDLNHFYKYRASDFALLAGPVSYAKATFLWFPDTHPEWDAVVNAIFYIDGGLVTYAGNATVETIGPDGATTSPVCYFPPIP